MEKYGGKRKERLEKKEKGTFLEGTSLYILGCKTVPD